MNLSTQNSLYYLKLTRLDDYFVFDIYRKSTYTDNNIPVDSLHPHAHKMATFNSRDSQSSKYSSKWLKFGKRIYYHEKTSLQVMDVNEKIIL